MNQSSTTAHRPANQQGELFRQQWTAHHRLARWLVWHKLRHQDGSVSRDHEDLAADALAFAWREFCRLRLRHPNAKPDRVIRWACKIGVCRVCSGMRFSPKPYPGYVDALDRRPQTIEGQENILAIPAAYRVVRDANDRSACEALIEQLPNHLRAVARLLSYGMPRNRVAKQRGISRSRLAQLIADLRWWFS